MSFEAEPTGIEPSTIAAGLEEADSKYIKPVESILSSRVRGIARRVIQYAILLGVPAALIGVETLAQLLDSPPQVNAQTGTTELNAGRIYGSLTATPPSVRIPPTPRPAVR